MHTHYSGCSLQGNASRRLALVTQVPSIPLAVGYQKKKACICLSHVLQELNISLHLPLWTSSKLYSGLQGDLGLAAWCGGARLRYLLCSVSVPLTGNIRRREARAGSCLLFLLHTSLQDFIILQVNKWELGGQQDVSSTAGSFICGAPFFDREEAPGYKTNSCERGDGRTRTGYSNKHWLPLECWDADIWPLLTKGWVNLWLYINKAFITLPGLRQNWATTP